MITFYTTYCPKCKILKQKLDMKGIQYNICDDVAVMVNKGFEMVPVLDIDGKIMTFNEAVAYINKIGDE